ncbi:hypothetical protein J8F10_11820 [Gemmata sp. G18]|uniref:DUF3185 domain-containing protein n=1 Tax=Gemmata palustris TaxID=2822762 RepID=A0ABS5BQF8_9BACT|nr:hypothetical protein [Gemmata palustris]MBP3955972.1 hypothetical protein [Gemmata palustris]
MRIVGIILVALGAMALGWEGFSYVTTEQVGDGPAEMWREKERTIWVPPLVSGIVVVSGLLLLASNGRREEL